MLARDHYSEPFRQRFADGVRQLTRSFTQGPFVLVASAVERIEQEWEEHAFLVAAYAVWRVATNIRILSASRNVLETILRKEATFLGELDFK